MIAFFYWIIPCAFSAIAVTKEIAIVMIGSIHFLTSIRCDETSLSKGTVFPINIFSILLLFPLEF